MCFFFNSINNVSGEYVRRDSTLGNVGDYAERWGYEVGERQTEKRFGNPTSSHSVLAREFSISDSVNPFYLKLSNSIASLARLVAKEFQILFKCTHVN